MLMHGWVNYDNFYEGRERGLISGMIVVVIIIIIKFI